MQKNIAHIQYSEMQPLIEKYLEGRTNKKEEDRLRLYFSSDSVDPRHQYLSTLFTLAPTLVAQEVEATDLAESLPSPPESRNLFSFRRIASWTSVAAVVAFALTLGITQYKNQHSFNDFGHSYVIVAGEHIDNSILAEHMALEALDATQTTQHQDIVDFLLPNKPTQPK
ncbi:hypothetical protein HQ45_08475 [Porphyromonas crevioricanis]|uniref:Uncharacterized protein n=2 Tax=Porphyromonas crevioricanis TaxID=393921 RepID=A0A0A2FUS7_9PORP|nr:hypothetical protein [Porphyromonas crevioricanis]KGN88723.1 hypothetical protein HQ45_08475 [Porphyromonas crevioricanis]KGN93907.1 hypothetical protein HQ38_07795 [Porphyromonas crevioricanis]SJZ89402.1 hypothetical protein SAMN02745203_01193 [Porphyromonas crevioricanis]SQH73661.1 Uncharacterised protein [Porphyromonas crevioricanis]GAD05423.1 hypothetical protein PORCRE_1125 [Porphyromonas crevioricanis JCM 15906]